MIDWYHTEACWDDGIVWVNGSYNNNARFAWKRFFPRQTLREVSHRDQAQSNVCHDNHGEMKTDTKCNNKHFISIYLATGLLVVE